MTLDVVVRSGTVDDVDVAHVVPSVCEETDKIGTADGPVALYRKIDVAKSVVATTPKNV